MHSAIEFVSLAQRDGGADMWILDRRDTVYEKARRRHPERWSGEVRNRERVEVVRFLRPGPLRSRVVQDIPA